MAQPAHRAPVVKLLRDCARAVLFVAAIVGLGRFVAAVVR